MKFALLKCDCVSNDLRHIAGDYEDMFQAWLPKVPMESFDAINDPLPSSRDFDGYIISGSRYSVYESHQWISDLQVLVQDLYSKGKKTVGVCFGHQLIAQVFGGKVERHPQGWCVGLHSHDIELHETHMYPDETKVNLYMSCHDQVIELPSDATYIGGTHSCLNGLFQMDKHIFTVQGHPEFPKQYLEALIRRRVDKIGQKKSALALQSLVGQNDSELMSLWVSNFLEA